MSKPSPDAEPGPTPPDDAVLETMEAMFGRLAPAVSVAEAHQIKRLIRGILQHDLTQRPTAAEILQGPWFAQEWDKADEKETR